MKKFTLLIAVMFVISCGKNKSEQMLYDYQQKNVSALNFDLNDLDFKIQKIEKIKDITAADSIRDLKQELAEYWTKNPEQTLVDTLSFEYVKNVLNESITKKDTLRKLYQEAALTYIRIGDYSNRLKSERKRDKAIDEMFDYKEALSKIEKLGQYYKKLSYNPDSILSAKYNSTYSLKNPMLGNTKQTFDKYFYTNVDQTEFIKEEEIEKE